MPSENPRRSPRSLPPSTTKRKTGTASARKKKTPSGLPTGLIIGGVGLAAVGIIVVVVSQFMGGPAKVPESNVSVPVNNASGPVSNASVPESSSTAVAASPVETPYLERLSRFKTKLIHIGPSPQPYQPELPPDGIVEVNYATPSQPLKAWVWIPPTATATSKVPGVIYYHGGFAFGGSDFGDAMPFVNAGFAVMCPMLRGENGNPGNFELYGGEVEDARTAVTWFTSQSSVDASRVYTFGHSAGGVISALLSLHDVPIRYGGSSGGLYGVSLFDVISELAPFPLDDAEERQMRVLVGNIKWMKNRHVAYVGRSDLVQEVAAAKVEATNQPLLTIIEVDGDHHSSLPPSAQAFAKYITENP